MEDNQITATSTNIDTADSAAGNSAPTFSFGEGLKNDYLTNIYNSGNLNPDNPIFNDPGVSSYFSESSFQRNAYTADDGNLIMSFSEASISATVDSDGTLSSTETTVCTDSDGKVDETTIVATDTITITPAMTWQDILNGYGSFQNASEYLIGGRENPAVQYFTDKNSNSYSTNNFFDVGNRNGYLNGFNIQNGVMNFIDAQINSILRQNDYVSFNMANGTSFQALTNNNTEDIFQYSADGINVSYAKLGYQDAYNTLTYEDGVNFYNGGNFDDKLRVIENVSRNIHLDGSLGVIFSGINNIDATDSSGDNELFGNSENNEIRSGNGNDSLWGQGGNDILYGGTGSDTFIYGVNEGNDVIFNSSESDNINLWNVSLSDIVSTVEIGDNFVINMTDGNSLRIVGENGASNFMLGDKSAYHYDRTTHAWTQTDNGVPSTETQDISAE